MQKSEENYPMLLPARDSLRVARRAQRLGTLFAQASLLLGPQFAFMEMTVIPNYGGMLMMILPPAGFLVLGLLLALKRLYELRATALKNIPPAAASDTAAVGCH